LSLYLENHYSPNGDLPLIEMLVINKDICRKIERFKKIYVNLSLDKLNEGTGESQVNQLKFLVYSDLITNTKIDERNNSIEFTNSAVHDTFIDLTPSLELWRESERQNKVSKQLRQLEIMSEEVVGSLEEINVRKRMVRMSK
jgi:hypothetical protein